MIRSLLVGSISRELNASFSQTTGDISKEAINRFETYTSTNTQNYVSENQSFFNNSDLSPSIKPTKNNNEENCISQMINKITFLWVCSRSIQ